MNFGVGTPRSGTAQLAYLLAEAGFLQCRHEYLLFTTDDELELARAATDYYEGRSANAQLLALVRRYRAEPRLEMDCDSKLTFILPVLFEEYPEAKLVHVVRDPRSNVRALYNLDYYGDLIATKWREALPAIRRPDWGSLSPLEKNCAFWLETHRLALEAAQGRPYFRIRFEELTRVGRELAAHIPATRETLEPLRQLFSFLGLACPPDRRLYKVAQTHVDTLFGIKSRIKQRRADAGRQVISDVWRPEERRALVAMCGEMAASFGYDLEQPEVGVSA
jgi:hypothetical protein